MIARWQMDGLLDRGRKVYQKWVCVACKNKKCKTLRSTRAEDPTTCEDATSCVGTAT